VDFERHGDISSTIQWLVGVAVAQRKAATQTFIALLSRRDPSRTPKTKSRGSYLPLDKGLTK
jgi:hypothetical protein